MSRMIAKHLAKLLLTRNARRFVRTAVSARSLRTAVSLHWRRHGVDEISVAGVPGTLRLRPGTSDSELLRILANGYEFPEYRVPPTCRPEVILDLGANIGVASILFARRFPNARIYAFEPLPENFELLAHNVSRFPNVWAIPYGLGFRSEKRAYYRSVVPENMAGGGFHSDGGRAFDERGPRSGVVTLQVLGVADAFAQYGIERADLIKIDTEGAEYEIIRGIPRPVLATVQTIVGELHGIRNEQTLAYLKESGFNVTSTFPHEQVGYFQATRNTRSPQDSRRHTAAANEAYALPVP